MFLQNNKGNMQKRTGSDAGFFLFIERWCCRMAEMTAKQKRFCDEYLIDLNATQAAIRAGYSEKTAYSIGEQNLRKLELKNYIEERMNIKQEDSPISLKITKDRLKKFHDPELKNIYSKKWTINLRIITITNKNGEKYSLLTNIPKTTSNA